MAGVRRYRAEETPAPFLDLAWRVFFASRSRGVSMEAHFPWLKGGGREDRTWCLEEEGRPAAMLAVRKGVIDTGDMRPVEFHAIGLVCTAPAFQRRGLASRLVEAVLRLIGPDAPVLLWTSKHDFYAKFGFQLADPTLVAECNFRTGRSQVAMHRTDWRREEQQSRCFGGTRGLPAFVQGAERVWPAGHPNTSFVLSTSPTPALLDMEVSPQGEAEAIALLGLARVTLNLFRRTSLLDELKEQGAQVTSRATNIAMWRPGRFELATIANWDIPLLDRF